MALADPIFMPPPRLPPEFEARFSPTAAGTANWRTKESPSNELRGAWRMGRAAAGLKDELNEAAAGGALQTATCHFLAGPEAARRCLDQGLPLESGWSKVVTQFGKGRASINLQFVLAPRKRAADGAADGGTGGGIDDGAGAQPVEEAGDDSNADLGRTWHFLIRCRELGRVTDDGDETHWAARLVLGAGGLSGEGACSDSEVVAAVPDHRSIWPACREVHAPLALLDSDPVLEEIRSSARIDWRVAVSVFDAGGPVEGSGRDWGDCC